jgi:ketosteroid isomerase-like protein
MTLAERFVAAVRAADPAAYGSLCSADSRHWVNIGSVEHSLDERVALLARERELLAEFDMVDVRVQGTESGFVVQATARGALHSGEAIEMALCAVVTCDSNDQITRVEEYVDSAAAAPLLRAVFAAQ